MREREDTPDTEKVFNFAFEIRKTWTAYNSRSSLTCAPIAVSKELGTSANGDLWMILKDTISQNGADLISLYFVNL